MSQSDLSCCLNSNSELVVGAAEIVIVKDSLEEVLNAMLIAQTTF